MCMSPGHTKSRFKFCLGVQIDTFEKDDREEPREA